MKWVNLLNDIKEKVGLTPHNLQDQQLHPSTSSSSSPASSSWPEDGNAVSARRDLAYSSSSPRSKHKLVSDFKRFWEVFRSSGSEKEKEAALNMSVDAFCKLLKQQANAAQLVTMLVETHIFSFVVGRAFVTDVEKLTTVSETSFLDVVEVIKFFTEGRKDGLSLGSNLLTTIEVLVSVPIDKQSLLDSGILCCLVHILNALLLSGNTDANKMASDQDELMPEGKGEDGGATHSGQVEVEGKVVHIMKALATHPSAAQSLTDDDSLQLLFQMVVNGSLNVFSQHKDGLVSLHLMQLHRHAMQILALLLVNDSGGTAKYISKHQLIKVLLTAIKDFNPACGDAAYTMCIVDMLLECVQLSYRPEAGGVRLREDIRNAHGHQFLVQFALTLSTMSKGQSIDRGGSYFSPYQILSSDLQTVPTSGKLESEDSVEDTAAEFPPLSRLLDVLVNLAQLGPAELTKAASSKFSHAKGGGHGRSRSRSSSIDLSGDAMWETNNSKVKDLEAVQMLQDIFLKSDNAELQAEVLNRMFKIFSSHIENYKLCQQLRTVPLLILNMDGFPPPVQDIILKILEYAVTVVNCIPEQELLSLCCLLQQPITANLKHAILSFFVKLLSFDQQYKKVLREVGVLEVLLDDLKNHKDFSGSGQENSSSTQLESNFKKHLGRKDAIIASPRLISSGLGRFLLFEMDSTISIAWDCMASLLKRAETNQSSFRSANGVNILLPFLASDVHRQGVLRTFSCLIMEDIAQAHPNELGVLLEVLKSGTVFSASGSQFELNDDAKSDIFGALCHILGVNSSAQKLFGEATGFSLLLTTLNGFRSEVKVDNSSPGDYIKVFTCLMRAMTAGVHGNVVNRTKLHMVISSPSFYDLLRESGLLCAGFETQVIHLFLELALEIVLPPVSASSSTMIDSSGFVLMAPTGAVSPDSERVYNAGAITVIISALLLFTSKVQLDVLDFIEKLARAGPFNQENLTAAGCVELLLDMIQPFLSGPSSLFSCALRIIEILGAYRLSNSELRLLMRYTLQKRQMNSGCSLVEMMERLILREDMASGNVSLAPFMLMDMSKMGHASIHVPMGERSWPPVAGYSFACWFQFRNFLKSQVAEHGPSRASSKKHSGLLKQKILRVFSVGSVDSGSTFYAELYLQEDGVLTLATSNSSSISFSGLELEEGQWHHLAVVHSKPNALAGLFQSSVAYIYVNGKLRHTGKLGYSPSPVGKALQIIIGTPVTHARVSGLQWKLRSCYLFEEVLSSGSVYFMYILGRGYRGIFQDTNLLQFVPNQACGGDNMAILDTLEADQSLASGPQRLDTAVKTGSSKADGSGLVWDSERLGSLPFQLSGKKLIFAFDGTCTELRASGAMSLLNLVDPTSAAASPIGGIPRFGRLSGDITICRHCVIGDAIRPIGGIAVVLALVEAAETKEMLHMALALLACVLHQNPQNLREMQACRGYHLLSLFLYRRMSLFDMYCLEIFFKVAACEASFSEPKKLQTSHLPPIVSTFEGSLEDLNFAKFREEFSSVGSQGDIDDFSAMKDTVSRISELDSVDIPAETSNCIVLSNADMVEHVLLDWTLWVIAPVSIQIALLGFLEHLVSIHWYRNHNLTVLRKINLVQHLLVTLQRGDVEVPVLEKLVILLGVILEDGFLASELESVVRFVIMTFDPPVVTSRNQIPRESMGKHVIVRNMLLEMLIDLQMTIKASDLLEQWHKIVSSKLITYFLDEAVHPTSMRWIMTLLGVCLTCSPTFQLKFRTSGGYQGLTQVLSSFYDSPDIYYILFCLIFGKPVYPRLPEVRMLDFHALIPSDGNYGELKFVELLDSVIAMAKSTFDRLSMRLMVIHQNGNLSTVELADENTDMIGELQGEALMHKTYAARLMGGEASAPAAATSVLRFMVDLAKMCPAFSILCRQVEILENCTGLYFSCARAFYALKLAKSLPRKTEEKSLDDREDNSSSRNTFSSLPHDQEQSARTSVSAGSFIQGQASASSDDTPVPAFDMDNVNDFKMVASSDLSKKEMEGESNVVRSVDDAVIGHGSIDTTKTNGGAFQNMKDTLNVVIPTDSQSSASMPDSPLLPEKSNSRVTPASPAVALSTLTRGSVESESKVHSVATPSVVSSASTGVGDQMAGPKSNSRGGSTGNTNFVIDSKLLLEMDDSGYGGGPCTAGSTAVLDFMAEVLSDVLTEQLKAVSVVENILESTPLYINSESTLVFQGLCFSRIMNFLERRLLRDDEESGKKLDKNRWSTNLDALCWLIVDRVYMGAFPRPVDVLRILEFLLSMLQLANKDGRLLVTSPSSKGLLSIGRGSKPLEAYIHAILKNTNRMILYCFLPSFLSAIGEDDLLRTLGLLDERKKSMKPTSSREETGVDICTVLQLLDAHMQLILCPSNIDKDLNCCLCINLISLLHDRRQTSKNIAIDILKYLLVHRRAALEDLLGSKPNQGPQLDVLHGGFDKLLTKNSTIFMEWFQDFAQEVNQVLERCAGVMWVQYIAGSSKFPGVRIKGMDGRRRREMGRKAKDVSMLELKHWEQLNERRYALELVRDAMSTELRVVRQDKYGWVLHAESEWQTLLQHLVHERGIFPVGRSPALGESGWQLCPIEGPYRMRKKLDRCKLRLDATQDALDWHLVLGESEFSKPKNENNLDASDSASGSFSHHFTDSTEVPNIPGDLYDESSVKESDYGRDDRASSVNEPSLHSAIDFGNKSVGPMSDSGVARYDSLESPRPLSSVKNDELRGSEDRSEKELLDNGEYLIRPYLEHLEKIRFKYNCERVVGLDKRDGVFLIGELCLYVIENFYIDDSGCLCEKASEDELSVIDQALGVKKDLSFTDFQSKSTSSLGAPVKTSSGGRAWAYTGGAWGKEKICAGGNMPHLWRMWKLDSVHEVLKRDYQLRPVAIEVFSMDGCNDLLVFHKKEREEVFKNLVAMNLPRNSMLDTTISGLTKQESNEGSRLFKLMAKSFSKRWQNGEISNFQYLMHLNTLAGRGYSDLTQYPVFPWILADYESEDLDLSNPLTFRALDRPMGCQTEEGKEEFRKRYESWDDPEIPKFHYGSHYSSAGIVLFYLIRLPPFSIENQKLQGGQFDHADRLFNSVRDTWSSAAGRGNTSDVKELIPEFFYLPEFLENRFGLDLGEKQSGEKVGDVLLPPWAKGSVREFIRKHREALECDYVSQNLHHWIDLIFGYKQRGKAAEEAVNVFYHYTYEGNVDIDAVTDPAMKASILAQINHFGQTPKQLFPKPHVKRQSDMKRPPHPLRHAKDLLPHELKKTSPSISQIITLNDKILVAGPNTLLKPKTHTKYVKFGFPDRSLRFLSYDQDRVLSTHENLHGGNQIQCAGVSHDGHTLVTGGDEGLVSVWRITKKNAKTQLELEKALSAHTARVTCIYVSQPYMLLVTGSDDCSVIFWDLSSFSFVRQLPEFQSPISAVHVNDLTGEVVTAAGSVLAVWSINGDCLAVKSTSQLPSDSILCVTTCRFSDWLETNWLVTGHQSGAVKVWKMAHATTVGGDRPPEYNLVLHRQLKGHRHSVTAVHVTGDLKQLLTGDSEGRLLSWTLPDNFRNG